MHLGKKNNKLISEKMVEDADKERLTQNRQKRTSKMDSYPKKKNKSA